MSKIFHGPPLPYIPDNLTVPQFILDERYPIRPLRKEGVPWLVDDISGRTVGYEELRATSFGLANALHIKYGLGEDDVVCLFSANHIDYPVVTWAVHRLGAAVTTANPAYTSEELLHQLTTVGAQLLVVQPAFVETALSAARAAGISTERIVVLDSLPGTSYATLQELTSFGLRQPRAYNERHLAPGEAKTKVAFYCFSSGTTGKPKAVAIAHYAVIANVIQLAFHHHIMDESVPFDKQRFRATDVCTAILPFFHIYGLVVNLHFVMFCGIPLVVFQKFNFTEMLDSIERYRITTLMLVPPMMVLLCKHPAAKGRNFSHVRACYSGAAPLSLELTQQMTKVFPGALVGQGYGMTETCTAVNLIPVPQTIGNGSVGPLLPGCSAKVVKQDGNLAAVGETGELVVTGPNMALRYENNPEATKATFVDGWVYTGDEVYFDGNGEMFVVDRLKELIKVRGFQVAPAELEGHLLGHPYVADACVVPVPDDYSGEVPMAFVVPSPHITARIKDPKEAEAIKTELIKHVADHKTKYKHLAGGVQFIDSIPKNPSGKLLRRVLRDEVRRQLAAPKTKAKL